ncbi:hypothetical protein FNV43_RR02308 [Rhamnella rubrinervis]|uniref:F-box domain-containing protein n=1 Tax=Rhamnella rubrinervis TaxID=2594499 RepID=A0A8K0HTE9_9ROSA|nr:hypothetical protein FNV43_RR02308 [Rhamnella rubrinervis]
MVGMSMLPAECISYIISYTSPMDACRSSLVCRLFRSAADSDVVWGRFLPHDHLQILSQSDLASSMHWLSKKELFFRLSHCPVLVGDDRNRVQEGFQLNGETHPGIGSGYQIGNSRVEMSMEESLSYDQAFATNYTLWRHRMEDLLSCKDLFDPREMKNMPYYYFLQNGWETVVSGNSTHKKLMSMVKDACQRRGERGLIGHMPSREGGKAVELKVGGRRKAGIPDGRKTTYKSTFVE